MLEIWGENIWGRSLEDIGKEWGSKLRVEIEREDLRWFFLNSVYVFILLVNVCVV